MLNRLPSLKRMQQNSGPCFKVLREQLDAVNDEVCALRALVADPSVPSGPVLEPPPLPAPRTPPPPSQDLDIAQPLDQEMGSCENEEELEWQPVRRLNKLGVIKGFTKQRDEKNACLRLNMLFWRMMS